MDHTLSCNNLKCRAELADRALVTTCSHIFCLDCANRQALLQCDGQSRRICPACGAELAAAEDAAVTSLRPTEAYKTSILSGLSPNTIMECAGRALSFWAYQTTQDIYFQQHLYKTLTDKYSQLTVRLEQVVNEANAEIEGLQRKVSNAASEHDNFKRKSEDLANAYKDKSRKLLQTQEMYDRLKRRVEMGHIERAASDAVDSRFQTLKAAGSHSFDLPQQNTQNQNQQHTQPGPSSLRASFAGDAHHVRPPTNAHSSYVPVNTTTSWNTATTTTSHPPGFGGGQFGRAGPLDGTRPSYPSNATGVLGSEGGNAPVGIESTRFGQGLGGLDGIGLSSGLKVSQPMPTALGLAMAGLRRS